MRTRQTSYLNFTHPRLGNWLNLEERFDDVYAHMLQLEATRDKALELLPDPRLSQAQLRALDILRHQRCLEQLYHQRCEALRQSNLPQAQQAKLRHELAHSRRQARQRLMTSWPELSSAELEALPLLLMRQALSDEIETRLEALKVELSCQGC